jgi:hypothetical protein
MCVGGLPGGASPPGEPSPRACPSAAPGALVASTSKPRPSAAPAAEAEPPDLCRRHAFGWVDARNTDREQLREQLRE